MRPIQRKRSIRSRLIVELVACTVLSLCWSPPISAQTPFAEARKRFTTSFHDTRPAGDPVSAPPPSLGRLVHYPSGVGPLAALLTPIPHDGHRHPAIVWITGGDSTTIDVSDLGSASPDNDQTAEQYRQDGIVTFYPSLRGGNDNPGHREGYFGEVDDVIAAADWLARQPGIDPARIYLGGHSTGGTLVLLVAEASRRFRATSRSDRPTILPVTVARTCLSIQRTKPK